MADIVKILTVIIGLATIAVLVSKNAATADVIKSASGGFSNILRSAIAPVMG